MKLNIFFKFNCCSAKVFCLALLLSISVYAQQLPEASLAGFAQQAETCIRPAFQLKSISAEGQGGYGIEVDGQQYWVAIAERRTLHVLQKNALIAQVKLDRPPAGEFQEQQLWRKRWLEAVAQQADSVLQPSQAPAQAQWLTLNKEALKGKFAGLSVLMAPEHQVFAQIDWVNDPAYADMAAFLSVQQAVMTRLAPCLTRAR